MVALLPALLLVPGASSAADTQVGQTVPENVGCFVPAVFFQVSSTGASYVVPSAGVLTSVRMSANANLDATRGLRVLRPAAQAGDYTVAGAGEDIVIPAGTPVDQQVRVPVQAGDLLGQYDADYGPCSGQPGGQNDRMAAIYSNPAVGSAVTPAFSNYPGLISVQATLEPDADGDGYGDSTQDLCPTDASTHDACPAPAQPTPSTQPTPTTSSAATFSVHATHRSHHRVQVDASGLKPGETYTITLGRFTVTTGTATTAGTLDEQVRIPACVYRGSRLVKVVGSQADRRGADRINIGRPRAHRCT